MKILLGLLVRVGPPVQIWVVTPESPTLPTGEAEPFHISAHFFDFAFDVDHTFRRAFSEEIFCFHSFEKKPLRRFHPGSLILPVSSFGCNLCCPFWQNS